MDKNNLAPLPVALHGVALLMTGCAYVLMTRVLIVCDREDSALGRAAGKDRKGIALRLLCAAPISLAIVNERIALALDVLVADLWFIPEQPIERMLAA